MGTRIKRGKKSNRKRKTIGFVGTCPGFEPVTLPVTGSNPGQVPTKPYFKTRCKLMGTFPDVNSVNTFVIDLLTQGRDLDWNSKGLL